MESVKLFFRKNVSENIYLRLIMITFLKRAYLPITIVFMNVIMVILPIIFYRGSDNATNIANFLVTPFINTGIFECHKL